MTTHASNVAAIFPYRAMADRKQQAEYSRAVSFIAEVIRLHEQGIEWRVMSQQLLAAGFSLQLARRAEVYWMTNPTILEDAKALYARQQTAFGLATFDLIPVSTA